MYSQDGVYPKLIHIESKQKPKISTIEHFRGDPLEYSKFNLKSRSWSRPKIQGMLLIYLHI